MRRGQLSHYAAENHPKSVDCGLTAYDVDSSEVKFGEFWILRGDLFFKLFKLVLSWGSFFLRSLASMVMVVSSPWRRSTS